MGNSRAERILTAVIGCILLSGCSALGRSDSFGAEGRIKIGGLVGYIANIDIYGKVGFYKQHPDRKTCPHCGKETHDDEPEELDLDGDPLGLLHFL